MLLPPALFVLSSALFAPTPAGPQEEGTASHSTPAVQDPNAESGFEGGFEGGDLEEDTLANLSIPDLMSLTIEVTSVSKHAQSLADTSAAITVLTAEDVRRLGATSIMEALRVVPGLHVARLAGGTYAISARGSNSRFANKMLVLVDGRTVYNSLFSGTFWEIQDLVLEDLDRIEVIRGPGAALWGANAVNGVVNIITKDARRTQGALLSLLGGNEERAIAAARYGFSTGDSGAVRVFAKYFERDALHDPNTDVDDDWKMGQVGFRGDWGGDGDDLHLSGGIFEGSTRTPMQVNIPTPPYSFLDSHRTVHDGFHVLGRWTRRDGEDSELTVQSFAAHTGLDFSWTGEQRDMFDLELQHSFRPAEAHRLVWGLGHRIQAANFEGSPSVTMNPEENTDQISNAFVQDEIDIGDRLQVVVGAKAEHDTVSDRVQLLPNLRALYRLADSHRLWASVSRAVRTPAQSERDLELLLGVIPDMGSGFDTHVLLTGSDVDPEELLAYELGYRFGEGEDLYFDVTAFYHSYDEVIEQVAGTPFFAGPTLVQPISVTNGDRFRTWGIETSGHVRLHHRLTLSGAYSFLRSSGTGIASAVSEDPAPHHQANLRAYFDLAKDWELDGAVYYVDDLASVVDPYVRADLRLGHRLDEHVSLSLAVQGLFHDSEPEFVPGLMQAANEVEAGAYLQLVARF